MSKNYTEFERRQVATRAKIYKRNCQVCNVETLMAKNQKYCSAQCKGKVKYINGGASTENQYKHISGNWVRYVSRLMYYSGRKRDKLNREIILKKLEQQNYCCALTGTPLTCELRLGTISKTNASVDRIIAGGPYTEDNIQIVCRAVNTWRSDLTIQEFIEWCKKVVKYNEN